MDYRKAPIPFGHHWIRVLACIAMAGTPLLAIAPARADDASCAMMRKVEARMAHTTYYQTTTFTGRQMTAEGISTPTAVYVKTPGGWMRMGASAATRAKFNHMFGTSLTDCHKLHGDQVDGHAADAYAMTSHDDRGDIVHAIVWLSRDRQLPLRVEADVDRAGKTTHMSMHIRYDNVQVPAHAKGMFSLDSLFGGHH